MMTNPHSPTLPNHPHSNSLLSYLTRSNITHSSFTLSSPPTPSSNSFVTSKSRSNHSRVSSQPSTPLPVKETLHGSLSQNPQCLNQRQLNQYLLFKSIGSGSFGSVELARDLSSPNQLDLYAVKEYSKSRLRKIQNRNNRFRRTRSVKYRALANKNPPDPNSASNLGMQLVKTEVAIMKKLAHQNIVTLHEVIDTDHDSLFFVLELCQFGPIIDLEKQIRGDERGLGEEKARNIFRQIVLGIEYLHFNEILHLDIKPDNILYYQDPNVVERPICKIVDFGISEPFQASGDDTLSRSSGSPGFLAPELYSAPGVSAHGTMVDIWAMGVTLYAILSGRLPFQDPDPIGLSEKIMNDPVLVPAEFSWDLKLLLNRLLDKSPDTRITMSELRNDEWVTEHGMEQLPDESMNLQAVEPPTQQEIDQAFKSLKSFATVFKAISKFRSGRKTSSTTNTTISDEGSPGGMNLKEPSTMCWKELSQSPSCSSFEAFGHPLDLAHQPCPSSTTSTNSDLGPLALSAGQISSSPLLRTPESDRVGFVSGEDLMGLANDRIDQALKHDHDLREGSVLLLPPPSLSPLSAAPTVDQLAEIIHHQL